MQGQSRVHNAAIPFPQARAALYISHHNADAAVEQLHAFPLSLHQCPWGVPAPFYAFQYTAEGGSVLFMPFSIELRELCPILAQVQESIMPSSVKLTAS